MTDDEDRCRFHCRTNKEAYLAGFYAGLTDAFDLYAPEPDERYREWNRGIKQTKGLPKSDDNKGNKGD